MCSCGHTGPNLVGGGGEIAYALRECVVNSPASPGSLCYREEGGKGEKEPDKGAWWPAEVWLGHWVVEVSPFSACPGLCREKAERRGWLRTPKVKLSSIIWSIIV